MMARFLQGVGFGRCCCVHSNIDGDDMSGNPPVWKPFDPSSLEGLVEWRDMSNVRILRDGNVAITNLATFNRRRKLKVWLWNVFCKDATFDDDMICKNGGHTEQEL